MALRRQGPPKPLGIIPLGDTAAFIEFAEELDLAVNAAGQQLAAAVRAHGIPWIRDVVPTLGGVALHFDPDHVALPAEPLQSAADLVEQCLEDGLPSAEAVGRSIEVPVCYDPEFALDLAEIAERARLSREDVVRHHAASEYRVLMVGFAPGLPYLGGLDARLEIPRRETPRQEVPAGSVAIANKQAVVYPYAISGGWNVIGRTPLVLFDAERRSPSLFAPGDRVRFVPVTREAFERQRGAAGRRS
jgi:inhibitor of KinA